MSGRLLEVDKKSTYDASGIVEETNQLSSARGLRLTASRPGPVQVRSSSVLRHAYRPRVSIESNT